MSIQYSLSKRGHVQIMHAMRVQAVVFVERQLANAQRNPWAVWVYVCVCICDKVGECAAKALRAQGKETSGQGTREKMGNREGREKPRARGSYVLKLEGIQRSKLEKQRVVE